MANICDNKGWAFKWTEKEDAILINNYPGQGYEAVKYLLPNRNKAGIQSRASKLRLKQMTYDREYFSIIDTSEKAYWVGFFYADGYVTTKGRFGIDLGIVDIGHLEKFKKSIKSNIRIRKRFTKNNGLVKNTHESCSIYIKNPKMQNDLINVGVLPNKTHCLKFPTHDQIPQHLMRDFIRGFIDGDGCYIFSYKDRIRKDRGGKTYNRLYKEISIVCYVSKFLEDLRDFLIEESGATFTLYKTNKDLFCLRMYDYSNMSLLINYLYYDGCLSLDRKQIKVNEILAYCLAH